MDFSEKTLGGLTDKTDKKPFDPLEQSGRIDSQASRSQKFFERAAPYPLQKSSFFP